MSSRDFQAGQIRVAKLIASRSGDLGSSAPSLLIYSASHASNLGGGLSDSNMLSGVGPDVFLFVSGNKNAEAFSPPGRAGIEGGTTLFGGDVVVSGTFYADKMVVELDQTTTGSMFVSGNLVVSASTTLYQGLVVNEGGGSDSSHDFRVESDGEDEALFVDASANTLYINKGESAFTTQIHNTQDVVLTVDSTGLAINEDGNSTVDFRVETDNKTHALFVDASTDQIILGSGSAVSNADVFFFVSGTQGSAKTGQRGASLFGGDLVVSGGLYMTSSQAGGRIELIAGGDDGTNNPMVKIEANKQSDTSVDYALQLKTERGMMHFDAGNASQNSGMRFEAGGRGVEWDIDGTVSTNPYFLVTVGDSTHAQSISLKTSDGGILIQTEGDGKKTHIDTNTSKELDSIHLDSAAGGIKLDLNDSSHSIHLDSESTADHSIHLDTRGGIFFDGPVESGLNGASGSMGSDTFLHVSGGIGDRGTTKRSVSVFAGDLLTSGSSYVGNFLDVGIGRADPVGTTPTGTGSLVVRYGPDAPASIGVGSQTIHLIGTGTFGAGAGIVFGDTGGDAGVAIVEDPDDGLLIKSDREGVAIVGDESQPAAAVGVLLKSKNGLVVVSSEHNMQALPAGAGTDVFFSVSGSVGSAGTSTKGTAIFGGDTTVSGTLKVGGADFHSLAGASSGGTISGSIHHTSGGLSYIQGGANVTVTSASNGQITITGAESVGTTGTPTNNQLAIWTNESTLEGVDGLKWDGANLKIGGKQLGASSAGTLRFYNDGADTNGFFVIRQANESNDVTNGAAILQNRTGSVIFGIGTGSLGGVTHSFIITEMGDANNKSFFIASGSEGGQILLLSGGHGTSPNVADHSDVSFHVSGAINAKGAASGGGTSVFGGDTVISGGLYLEERSAPGDIPDGTVVLYGKDASGVTKLYFKNEDGEVEVGSGGSSSGAAEGWVAAANNIISTTGSVYVGTPNNSNPDIILGSDGGAVFNEQGASVDFRIETNNKPNALFIDGSTDQVLILSGGAASDPNEGAFTDTNFFVSGAIGSKDSATKGTTLFGGDTVVSGVLYVANGLNGGIRSSDTAGSSIEFDAVGEGIFLMGDSNVVVARAYYDSDTSAGEFNVNLPNANIDFRVETTNPHALFVDASTGQIKLNSQFAGSDDTDATDTFFFVSGAIGSKDSATKGTSVFGGDTFISGVLKVGGDDFHPKAGNSVGGTISGSIHHTSGGLSYLQAGSNIAISSASNGQITIASSGGGDVSISGTPFNNQLAIWTNSSTIEGSDSVTYDGTTIGLNDAVVINEQGADNDFRVESNNKTHAIFVDGGTDQLVFGDNATIGSDSFVFVSGAIGNMGLANTFGAVTLGGDMQVSGTVCLGRATNEAANGFKNLHLGVGPNALSLAYATSDVAIMLSGTIASKDSSSHRGVTVAGGDLVVSGASYFEQNITLQGDILPDNDVSRNLGSDAKRFKNIYTGDLHLRNERGDWTILEEEDYLCVINNKSGKKFKMVLEQIDD